MKLEKEIGQKKFHSARQKALVNILFTANWLRDKQNKIFKPFGVLAQHYNILRILKGRYPDPCSPGEIKLVMLDKSPDVTRLIDKLVKMGLAERKLCEENRRKMDIKITEKGLELLSKIDVEMNVLIEGLHVEPDQANQLSDLLDQIRG